MDEHFCYVFYQTLAIKKKNTTFTSADIPIKLFWSKFVHSFKGYNVFVAVKNIYDYETVQLKKECVNLLQNFIIRFTPLNAKLRVKNAVNLT